MDLKVWLTGSAGQVGQAINKSINPLEIELLNTDLEELDITNIEQVLRYGELNRPDVIINCAGVTDLQLCSEQPEQAYRVNAIGARNLSIVAAKIGAKIIHISSDDVFDGKATQPYCEYDDTNPITVYGRSKLAGENYVKEFTVKHFIIRSSWIYGAGGNNFVNMVLEKAKKQEKIQAATDQYGSPTSAKAMAQMIMQLIHTNEYGTYHITCKGVCSRYEFAQEILRLRGINVPIQPIRTVESAFSHARPAYAVLDNFILRIIDMPKMPEWKSAIEEYLTSEGNA